MSADKTMTTYRRADGEPIYGEYGWVTDTEFFDDVDEPLEVVKEIWTVQTVETLTYKPPWWDAASDEDDAESEVA